MIGAVFVAVSDWVVTALAALGDAVASCGSNFGLCALFIPAVVGMSVMQPSGDKPSERDIAKVKYWLFSVVSKSTIGVVYVRVVAEAWRMLVPVLGKRFLFGMDGAVLLALALMVCVFYVLELMIMAWLGVEEAFSRSGYDPVKYKQAAYWVGGLLVVCDVGICYVAFAKLTWGGAGISLTALLATLVWLALLIVLSFFSAQLKRPLL